MAYRSYPNCYSKEDIDLEIDELNGRLVILEMLVSSDLTFIDLYDPANGFPDVTDITGNSYWISTGTGDLTFTGTGELISVEEDSRAIYHKETGDWYYGKAVGEAPVQSVAGKIGDVLLVSPDVTTTADINVQNFKLANVALGVNITDGVNKEQLDGKINRAGDTMLGQLKGVDLPPVADADLTRKDYVDSIDAALDRRLDILENTVSVDITYMGTFDPVNGFPDVTDITGNSYWISIGNGDLTFKDGVHTVGLGDRAVYNFTNAEWEYIKKGVGSDVITVAGRTGNVVITASDIEDVYSKTETDTQDALQVDKTQKVNNIAYGSGNIEILADDISDVYSKTEVDDINSSESVKNLKVDGSNMMLANLNMNAKKITGMAPGTVDDDAVNMSQLEDNRLHSRFNKTWTTGEIGEVDYVPICKVDYIYNNGPIGTFVIQGTSVSNITNVKLDIFTVSPGGAPVIVAESGGYSELDVQVISISNSFWLAIKKVGGTEDTQPFDVSYTSPDSNDYATIGTEAGDPTKPTTELLVLSNGITTSGRVNTSLPPVEVSDLTNKKYVDNQIFGNQNKTNSNVINKPIVFDNTHMSYVVILCQAPEPDQPIDSFPHQRFNGKIVSYRGYDGTTGGTPVLLDIDINVKVGFNSVIVASSFLNVLNSSADHGLYTCMYQGIRWVVLKISSSVFTYGKGSFVGQYFNAEESVVPTLTVINEYNNDTDEVINQEIHDSLVLLQQSKIRTDKAYVDDQITTLNNTILELTNRLNLLEG